MPVQIGAKPESNFTDPIGLMTDCHRRIERFLEILLRVARDAQGKSLTPPEQVALRTALDYFRDSAPKHTADEEDSLFPRLRSEAAAAAWTSHALPWDQIVTRMENLESDHVTADRAHSGVENLGRKWLDNGKLSRKDTDCLLDHLMGLQTLYQDHIAVEETQVFPAATRMLSYGARKAMGEEMAKRRGVPVVTKL